MPIKEINGHMAIVEEYNIINKEWNKGGFEIFIDWIIYDMREDKNLKTIHDFYMNDAIRVKCGKEKEPITEEQFYLAYKSAEIILKDRILWEKNKPRPLFKRIEDFEGLK